MKSAFNKFRRFYRQQQLEKKEQPFFGTKSTVESIQQKSDSAFFNKQDQDPYEKEADDTAASVVDNKSSGKVLQKEDINSVYRKPEEEEPIQAKKEEEKPIQKAEKKEVSNVAEAMVDKRQPIQKEEKKEEEKPIQKEEKKEEEKPVQKAEKKEEEKPIQKEEKKEEEKPVQKQGEEEEMVQKQVEEDQLQAKEEEDLQKKPETKSSRSSAKIGQKLQNTKGQGRTIPPKTRSEMEHSFGYNFKQVKIHTDNESVQLNDDLHAQAFTQGSDIYFNSGKYNPETNPGKRLLAHELTHVVQQDNSNIKKTQLKSGDSSSLSIQKQKKKEISLSVSSAMRPRVTRIGDSILGTFYFEQNSFLLNGENYGALSNLGKELHFVFKPSVLISGHASCEGNKKHNLELSEMRRSTVESIFKSMLNPVNKTDITSKAYGDSMPAVLETGTSKEEIESQRKMNRRVDILILKKSIKEPEKKLNLDLPANTGPETTEERVNRIIKEKPPEPIKKQSVSELMENKIDEQLETILRKANVPKEYRGMIKEAAIKGIEKGAMSLLDKVLEEAKVGNDDREMIKSSVRALMKTPMVR